MGNNGTTIFRIKLIEFSVLILFLSGCQTPQMRMITEEELVNRFPNYIRSYEADLNEMSNQSLRRIRNEYQQVKTHTDNEQPDHEKPDLEKPDLEKQSYDVLILSGGGAFGAFGAGFLSGWGDVKEKDFSIHQKKNTQRSPCK